MFRPKFLPGSYHPNNFLPGMIQFLPNFRVTFTMVEENFEFYCSAMLQNAPEWRISKDNWGIISPWFKKKFCALSFWNFAGDSIFLLRSRLWNELWTGDAGKKTGDPRWYIFLPGLSPLAFFFAGVEASGALGRDVWDEHQNYHHSTYKIQFMWL